MNKANRLGGMNKGMALTGLITGIIAVAISVLFLIIVYSSLYGFYHTYTYP
jgi:hypothetical protein